MAESHFSGQWWTQRTKPTPAVRWIPDAAVGPIFFDRRIKVEGLPDFPWMCGDDLYRMPERRFPPRRPLRQILAPLLAERVSVPRSGWRGFDRPAVDGDGLHDTDAFASPGQEPEPPRTGNLRAHLLL